MGYLEFKKRAAWFDEDDDTPIEPNRWGQAPVMADDGTWHIDKFDPAAYADARTEAEIAKRIKRRKQMGRDTEIDPEVRENLYQQYLNEGLQYADWEPPYHSVDEFLAMSPQDAKAAYDEYLASFNPKMESGRDEEGNYRSKLVQTVPREIIEAKYGTYDDMHGQILGMPGQEGQSRFYPFNSHIVSGMPNETDYDRQGIISFLRANPVSDEPLPSLDTDVWDYVPVDYDDELHPVYNEERARMANEHYQKAIQDYLQRNVYSKIPKPEDPNAITIESGNQGGKRSINAFNNVAKNVNSNVESGMMPTGQRYVWAGAGSPQHARVTNPKLKTQINQQDWNNRTINPAGAPRNIIYDRLKQPGNSMKNSGPQLAQNKQGSYLAFKKLAFGVGATYAQNDLLGGGGRNTPGSIGNVVGQVGVGTGGGVGVIPAAGAAAGAIAIEEGVRRAAPKVIDHFMPAPKTTTNTRPLPGQAVPVLDTTDAPTTGTQDTTPPISPTTNIGDDSNGAPPKQQQQPEGNQQKPQQKGPGKKIIPAIPAFGTEDIQGRPDQSNTSTGLGFWDFVKARVASDPDYNSAKTPEEKAQMFLEHVKNEAISNAGAAKLFGKSDAEVFDAAFRDRTYFDDVYTAADSFIESATPEDARALQRILSQMESEYGTDSENFQSFKTYVTNGLKTKVWDAVKANPLKNLPIAASLFLGQYSNGIANIVENPVVFYGGLLTMLLFGGRFIMSGAAPQAPDDTGDKKLEAYYNRVPYA